MRVELLNQILWLFRDGEVEDITICSNDINFDIPSTKDEYDGEIVRKYIKEIKVYEDKFMVCFRANIKVEVKR